MNLQIRHPPKKNGEIDIQHSNIQHSSPFGIPARLDNLHQLARRSPEKNLMGHSPKLLVVQTCSTQFKIVVILCGMFWFELNLCWWTPYVLNQTVFCKMIVLLEKKSHVEFGGCISCISHKVYGANFWWNFYPQNFVSWWIGPNGFLLHFGWDWWDPSWHIPYVGSRSGAARNMVCNMDPRKI